MILKTDKTLKFIPDNIETLKEIPPGNWLVRYNQRELHFYLEKQDDFELPKKVYGNVDKKVERYLQTFDSKNGNLGILLKGLKGTGKSLTAKALCIKSELPVILITDPFRGADFNNFISNIKQEAIIFIDEFEKIFNHDSDDYERNNTQASLLTLFDGVFESKKIFLLTANNDQQINNALINRPGRIRYHEEYKSLSDDVINDIIQDKLINKEYTKELKEILNILGNISIDSLVTIIDECNMYEENPKHVIKSLNIAPSSDARYDVVLKSKGVGSAVNVYKGYLTEHPLSKKNYSFHVYSRDKNSSSLYINVNLGDNPYKIDEDKIIIETTQGNCEFTLSNDFNLVI